jgi:serine/threonine-protein kinase
MAVVVAARHEAVGHRVAVKLLLPQATESTVYSRRALREARAAASLTSEHVTRVLDVGELESGEPYLVMELLEGQNFARMLKERGPLPVEEVATYLVQACEAIAEAHALGIVHRDLKPSNLFLCRRADGAPLVKLMDFGISKIVEQGLDDSLTTTHDSLGTPHYMSPEQLVSSRDIDTRTDVWALGVIAYRLLTRQHVFDGETLAALYLAIASAPAPRLRDARPDVPPELDQLIARCLVKQRADRLQSVAEFAAVLLPLTDADTRKRYAHVGQAPVLPPPASLSVTPPIEVEMSLPWGVTIARQRHRRRTIVAVAAVVVATGGSLSLVGGRAPQSQPAMSSVSSPREAEVPATRATTDPLAPSALASDSAVASSPSPPPSPSPAGSAHGHPPMRPRVVHPVTSAPLPQEDPYGERR